MENNINKKACIKKAKEFLGDDYNIETLYDSISVNSGDNDVVFCNNVDWRSDERRLFGKSVFKAFKAQHKVDIGDEVDGADVEEEDDPLNATPV